jgi:hypothetical protein
MRYWQGARGIQQAENAREFVNWKRQIPHPVWGPSLPDSNLGSRTAEFDC